MISETHTQRINRTNMSFMSIDVWRIATIMLLTVTIGCNAITLQDKYIKYADQKTPVNQSVTLSCHVIVGSPVNWWYRSSPSAKVDELCVNGNLINGHRANFNIDRVSFSLTIPHPTFKNSGTYTCVENSGLGTRHVTELTVTVPLKHYSIVVSPGQDIRLSCHQTADGKPVNWLFREAYDTEESDICVDGKLVEEHSERYFLDEASYDLTLIAVTGDDQGTYTCVENSGFGTKHATRLVVEERSENNVQSTVVNPSDSAPGTPFTNTTVFIPVVVAAVCTAVVLFLVVSVLFVLRVWCLKPSNTTVETRIEQSEQPDVLHPVTPDDKDTNLTVRSLREIAGKFGEYVVQNTISSLKKEGRTSVKSVSFSRQSSKEDSGRPRHRSESAGTALLESDKYNECH